MLLKVVGQGLVRRLTALCQLDFWTMLVPVMETICARPASYQTWGFSKNCAIDFHGRVLVWHGLDSKKTHGQALQKLEHVFLEQTSETRFSSQMATDNNGIVFLFCFFPPAALEDLDLLLLLWLLKPLTGQKKGSSLLCVDSGEWFEGVKNR